MNEGNLSQSNRAKIVKSVCALCSDHCGLDVHVENGEIVKVVSMPEDPIGAICVKGEALSELVHSSERLTDPLRRLNGSFKKISWDGAFEFISHKLADIKQKYGAKAVVVHTGHPVIHSHTQKIARRFADLYGTPNYTTGASFCFLARTIGQSLTCGRHLRPSFSPEGKCVVVWGDNATESGPVLKTEAMQPLFDKGAKLIVIDPRRTSLAKEADIHAQIRPGTDCALALGLINIIIAEGLYDEAFVEKYTVGFDKLVEHVKDYSPQKVEEITWVPAETVRNMARMYAANKPASIRLGISLDHCTNGIQTIRAVSTLIAITGNLDVAGGNIWVPALRQANLRVEEKVAGDTPVGADYPLFTKYTLEQTVTPAIDGILAEKPYPIKALLVHGSNLAVTWPNTSKVRKALEKLDLVVVIDIFMSDTANLADIVLPGTTFLERQDLLDYRNDMRDTNRILVRNKAVEPVGSAMEDWKIWAELGKRMGYQEYFPWKDSDELFEYLLEDSVILDKPSDISLEQLKQSPLGVYYAERESRRDFEEGFNTPSGKVEIYSETMEKHGYDPLPTFHEPAQSPVSRPDLVGNYPLILITGARTVAYLHSEFRNLPGLRKLVPEPLIEINPQTAGSLGIASGDKVKVESIRGDIEIKAELTEDIHPKVVSIQHGWSEANVNLLTDDEAHDPVSAYPGFRSVMCRVMKAKG